MLLTLKTLQLKEILIRVMFLTCQNFILTTDYFLDHSNVEFGQIGFGMTCYCAGMIVNNEYCMSKQLLINCFYIS